MIPIIDIFAGPGGLGEGFGSWRDARTGRRFELALSVEKDANAHATLRLRAFRRCFGENAPAPYDRLLRGETNWESLTSQFPAEAAKAEAEARRVELGPCTAQSTRSLINQSIGKTDAWVLIGGPPCQAYSIAGRSRNKGIADYKPELDRRQTLYVEYLQVVADHAPPVFVMENVKGLLSAQLNRDLLFDRIREDLRDPSAALRREGRATGRRRPRYEIRALVPTFDLPGDDPRGYVVRSEDYGVPQRRHRVVLLGVRDDVTSGGCRVLASRTERTTVRETLGDLPRVRSGLSQEVDSDRAWLERLKEVSRRSWMERIDTDVRHTIEGTLDGLSVPAASRGFEYGRSMRGATVLNHSTRSHMLSDLERYLFASSFSTITASSPRLSDFPKTLRPRHENVSRALGNGLFSDRFRVQVAEQPSTTITSHISKDGHYYIHYDPTQCRSLTVREAARLQTFPDDYFFCGPRTSQYHQVGNAVPPALARQIAAVVSDLF